MDMNQVYSQLDEFFSTGQSDRVEEYLIDCMKKAQKEEDYHSVIMLLNEMIGFCRETSQKEKSLAYSSQVIQLMNQLQMTDSVAYATTLLNVANACRAAGKLDEAYRFYMEVFPIYDRYLEPDDSYYAALYNNMSLLFQEKEEYERSVECLEKALNIITKKENSEFEVAVTHTNIATSLCKLSSQTAKQEKDLHFSKAELGYDKAKQIAKEALTEAKEAIETFRRLEVMDVHMAAACCSYADALVLLREYEEAREYYVLSMSMIENAVGKTEGYKRVSEKLAYANAIMDGSIELDEYGFPISHIEESDEYDSGESREEKNPNEISGLKLAKAYFETYGKRMLMEQFPEYLSQIAVGLCGEGSECLGFDDTYSTDHDFGPGFAMWVDDEVYEKIGDDLQKAYDALPKSFMGYVRMETEQGKGRCGVCTYRQYLTRILGIDHVPQSDAEWLGVSEEALLASVSGEVFVDPSGEFTSIRNRLRAYYPERIWRLKLAQEMTMFSQNGQYNYMRMLRRSDQASAHLLLGKACENAMKLVYLLNKQYAPHTKWLLRGMEEMEDTQMVEDLITGLLYEMHGKEKEAENKQIQIEKIAMLFLEKMKRLALLPESETDTYLAHHAKKIAYGMCAKQDDRETERSNNENIPANEKEREEESAFSKDEMVDAIVMLEWKAFDKVKNEGGRADCQDDFETFRIMRRSQYLTWDNQMLEQYIYDFKRQVDHGWNPIMEKYARMMESTAPERYQELKEQLPVISDEKRAIIEGIVQIQVQWMEEMAEKYPKVAMQARVIHTSEDSAYVTSYETYLRGELGTYSDDMLLLYGRFIATLAKNEQNLAMLTMEHTVKMYGYKDLQDAQEKMW